MVKSGLSDSRSMPSLPADDAKYKLVLTPQILDVNAQLCAPLRLTNPNLVNVLD